MRYWFVWHKADGRGVLHSANDVKGGTSSFEFRSFKEGVELLHVKVADLHRAAELYNELKTQPWLLGATTTAPKEDSHA